MLIGIAAVLLATSAAATAICASFEPGPGQAMLGSGATGVYELGRLNMRGTDQQLVALIHNGQVLQVHSRRRKEWLDKRSGSTGGKVIAPATLAQLAAISGGLNTDIRRAPDTVQAEFQRTADIVLLGDGRRLSGTTAAAGHSSVEGILAISTGREADCGFPGHQLIYEYSSPHSSGYRIKVNTSEVKWSFEGFGIVAIWSASGL